jgi:hypothetical protein
MLALGSMQMQGLLLAIVGFQSLICQQPGTSP